MNRSESETKNIAMVKGLLIIIVIQNQKCVIKSKLIKFLRKNTIIYMFVIDIFRNKI